MLAAEGNWSKYLAKAPTAKENLLQGLPGGPFVASGGAVLSDAAMEGMMKLSFDLMKSAPEVYGLDEAKIGQLSELIASRFKGIRSMSMLLGASENDEPLYANMLGIIRVDDAKKFMTDYENYIPQYNEIIKDSKSLAMQKMEIEKCEVGGIPSLRFKSDIPKPPNAAMTPNYDKLMENLVGPEGKMVFYITPADQNTIAFGFIDKGPLERMIASMKEKSAGMTGDADVSKTAALLPSDAQTVAYVSPQGTIQFVKRMMATLLPPGMAERMNIPDFPQSPPLGFAVKVAPNEVQTTLAAPVEVLKAIGQYVQHIRGMSGENVQ
jgi:hypothetical protein